MLIVGLNDWQNEGPAHGPQQRKPRAHALAHTHAPTLNSSRKPHISKSMLHTTSSHFISSHFISFHPASGPTQGPHQRKLRAHALANIHRNALKPDHKTNVAPNRASNDFPMLNVRSLHNNGSNHKHAHVAIFSSRCGMLRRFSNDV